MKVEARFPVDDYSEAILKKAGKLIEEKKCKLVFPTEELVETEEVCYRFEIYPENRLVEKLKEKLGVEDLPPEVAKRFINGVRYDFRKDIWVCTCTHWMWHGNDQCKHICSSKMIINKVLDDD